MLLELLFRLNQCLICAWFVPWCFALLCLISFSFKRLVLVVDRSWFCSVSLGKWITTQPPHPKHREREKKAFNGLFFARIGVSAYIYFLCYLWLLCLCACIFKQICSVHEFCMSDFSQFRAGIIPLFGANFVVNHLICDNWCFYGASYVFIWFTLVLAG